MLQSSLDKEREHRVRLEQELAEAFDAQLESQKETESVFTLPCPLQAAPASLAEAGGRARRPAWRGPGGGSIVAFAD